MSFTKNKMVPIDEYERLRRVKQEIQESNPSVTEMARIRINIEVLL
jgi:hypothetical protein